jgi:NIPSNAP
MLDSQQPLRLPSVSQLTDLILLWIITRFKRRTSMTFLKWQRLSPARYWASAVLLSFAAGCFVTARPWRPAPVSADANRVFELMIYHTLPGKAPELESVFRASHELQRKYGLDVIGYWMPNEDPAWKDTYVYLIAHPSRVEAEDHWNSLHQDPAFQPYREQAKPLIQHTGDDYKVDEIYMRPSDFSNMK